MAEIIKTYAQRMGAARFIGKKYTNSDRVNGNFGAKWGEWFREGWFDAIEKQIDNSAEAVCEDGGAYIGLMQGDDKELFEYWIGIFAPQSTTVPEGFDHIDFPESDLGVCWIYGKEKAVYGLEGQCGKRLEQDGFKINYGWCFERYACPRFTTPDENGNVILDICFYVEKP